MKKYLTARLRLAALYAAVALGTAIFIAPQILDARSTPEKIRLMAETLRARDSGDLMLAKDKAEELIKIAPDDENVQRLLGSINADLDRSGQGTAIYGKADRMSVEEAMEAAPAESMTGASAVVQEVADDQSSKVSQAEQALQDADSLAELGAYSDATSTLNSALASLTLNTATAEIIDELNSAKADVYLTEAQALAASGEYKSAEARLAEYSAAGGSSRAARKLAAELDAEISDPSQYTIAEISPEFTQQNGVVRDLLARGRAQYLNGDYDGAGATFKEIEARDPHNAEAKLFSTRIAEIIGGIHSQNSYKTRAQMLAEVDQNWERPKVFDVETGSGPAVTNVNLQEKLNAISIPQVDFSQVELSRVLSTLSELSYEYGEGDGVNIIPLYNASVNDPKVTIRLRDLNLDRILQYITQQVNYAYDVGEDAVTVTPDGDSTNVSTTTEFFPINRATVIRLTGVSSSGGSSGPVDPFAAPTSAPSSGGSDEITEALQNFFQRAGVNFDLPGTSLAFDDTNLIVTQTRRNIERMRNILRNYNDIKQVEIESKFLEVSQNDLDELGFDWNITDRNGASIFNTGGNRNITSGFGTSAEESSIRITNPGSLDPNINIVEGPGGANFLVDGPDVVTGAIDESEPVAPPLIPGLLDFAQGVVGATANQNFALAGGYDLDFAIRALSRKTGSDLMSAPRVTVLSGEEATIVVAQELLYPTSYGDIESQVSSGSGVGGGTASISILAGTPEGFEKRNVGVELNVRPTVEGDDTISLSLNPRVTEFEGFVEYGGPSVAIAGSTTVTIPAGFYQPIFSTREVSTQVTVFDGATVVMGGLTRDEVKTISDKVPVLGDIPGIGRLFRSEGESRQKRNLLIFVTANLVSPGGSPARQDFRTLNANSLFQNPTIMTPSGSVNRSIDQAE
jgi:general secretion pathway protein D